MAGSYFKMAVTHGMSSELYPWAAEFFRPRMSKLFNYLLTATAFAISYFVLFSEFFISYLERHSQRYSVWVNGLFIFLIIFALSISGEIPIVPRLWIFLILEILSLVYLFIPYSSKV